MGIDLASAFCLRFLFDGRVEWDDFDQRRIGGGAAHDGDDVDVILAVDPAISGVEPRMVETPT